MAGIGPLPGATCRPDAAGIGFPYQILREWMHFAPVRKPGVVVTGITASAGCSCRVCLCHQSFPASLAAPRSKAFRKTVGRLSGLKS